MKHSLKIGLCFGLTSGVITTLGLMVGLHSFSGSKFVIIGGVLMIAIADAFSDALGIHVSEEAEDVHSEREIWESTISTFFTKFVCSSTFIVPILLFELSTAIIISVVWGLLILNILSYIIAKDKKAKTWKVIVEHLTIALIVIVITHYVGDFVSEILG